MFSETYVGPIPAAAFGLPGAGYVPPPEPPILNRLPPRGVVADCGIFCPVPLRV
jgi:hypothetical protein